MKRGEKLDPNRRCLGNYTYIVKDKTYAWFVTPQYSGSTKEYVWLRLPKDLVLAAATKLILPMLPVPFNYAFDRCDPKFFKHDCGKDYIWRGSATVRREPLKTHNGTEILWSIDISNTWNRNVLEINAYDLISITLIKAKKIVMFLGKK
jgi:hypothetical protein